MAPSKMREIDSRQSDGIHVQLLWGEQDGRLAVIVTDIKTGGAFCLDVREGEQAHEVFHHPYAYAAWHGIDTAKAARGAKSDVPLAA